MWLDILTGTILIIAILQGYRNGLIKAVISFFSLMIGLILAFQFSGWVATLLKEHTKITSHWLPFISFLLILVLVLIILKFISGILHQTAEWLLLGWLNKLLGIVLYAFIYFTMLSAVVYFLQVLGVIQAAEMKEMHTYEYLQKWWPFCMEKMSILIPSIKSTIAAFSNPFK
ncbi:MAG: CvpA family protein [Bacteroidetes bacterium]|nr:CvpA family protein [Bacteroidota bacterium]